MRSILSLALVALMAISLVPDTQAAPPDGKVRIYALARQAGLTTLADAIEIAGLQRTLQVEGPFTVFAPTNEAFAALGEETLNAVISDVELLTSILLYHVAPGELMATDVLAESSIEMASGEFVSVDAGNVQVNSSNIVATDIMARNGVVHVIDSVLLPPSLTSASKMSAQFKTDDASAPSSWSNMKSKF